MPHSQGMPTLDELRTMSDGQLTKKMDEQLGHGQVNAYHIAMFQMYRDEYVRREQAKTNRIMLRYTLLILILTFVVTIATVVSLYLVYRQSVK
jgi:hypothetical protein